MDRRKSAYQKVPLETSDEDDGPIGQYPPHKGYQRPSLGKEEKLQRPGRYLTPSLSSGQKSLRSFRSAGSQMELTAHPSLSSVSVTLANLPVDERNFLVLIEDGNVANVEKFLEEHPNVNINCRDIHGVSGLLRAVRNENFDMVVYLVNLSHLYVGDTVLHAVELGKTEVLTLLLEGLRRRDEGLEFRAVPDSADFTSDITPLMLAAHLGNRISIFYGLQDDFNVVKLLVDRGHTLLRPHPPGCQCGRVECSGNKSKEFAKLEYTKRRYNSYRAVCSPSYISLNSKDVIKTCFKLCAELVNCSEKEAEIATKYTELADNLRTFVSQLIEQCNTTDEVELILKQRHLGAPVGSLYPRIYLGLQCNQKEFISHENCQQVLQAAWLDNWQDWRGMSYAGQLSRIVLRIGLFPAFALVYMAVPHPIEWLEQYMRPPIHRYILSIASYLTFLVLLFIETNHDRDPSYRGPPRSGLEFVLFVFVLGHTWDLFKKFQLQGSNFFSSWWNWYDFVNLSLFYSTFSIWYWSFLRAKKLPELNRMEWDWNEPPLIAEALFGFATIFAFGRLLHVFRVDRSMGPLLISIGNMAFDMVKFFVVFFCVILSFATGLNHMYETYADQVRTNSDGTNTTQSDAFMTFPSTAKTLFWALFGLAPPEAPDVIIGNIYANGTVWSNYDHREHSFTQLAGYLMFGLYHVVAGLILLNTLIAVMSNSYQKVEDNSDVEWKFARTQIWISYFDAGQSLPSPFNVVPTLTSALELVNKVLKKDELDTKAALVQRQLALRYSELQGRIIQAVFSKIEREKINDPLSEIQKSIQKIMTQMQI